MAFAAAKFAGEYIQGINGKSVVVPAFVNLNGVKDGDAIKQEIGKDLEYFSVPVQLGPNGVEKVNTIGSITDYEKQLFAQALDELAGNINKGIKFVKN